MIEYDPQMRRSSFAKRILLINGIALMMAVLIWWFLMERTLATFGIAYIVTGAITIFIGGVLFSSGRHFTTFDVDASRSFRKARVHSMNVDDHPNHDHDYQQNSDSDATLFFVAGMIPMLLGALIVFVVA